MDASSLHSTSAPLPRQFFPIGFGFSIEPSKMPNKVVFFHYIHINVKSGHPPKMQIDLLRKIASPPPGPCNPSQPSLFVLTSNTSPQIAFYPFLFQIEREYSAPLFGDTEGHKLPRRSPSLDNSKLLASLIPAGLLRQSGFPILVRITLLLFTPSITTGSFPTRLLFLPSFIEEEEMLVPTFTNLGYFLYVLWLLLLSRSFSSPLASFSVTITVPFTPSA